MYCVKNANSLLSFLDEQNPWIADWTLKRKTSRIIYRIVLLHSERIGLRIPKFVSQHYLSMAMLHALVGFLENFPNRLMLDTRSAKDFWNKVSDCHFGSHLIVECSACTEIHLAFTFHITVRWVVLTEYTAILFRKKPTKSDQLQIHIECKLRTLLHLSWIHSNILLFDSHQTCHAFCHSMEYYSVHSLQPIKCI